MLRSLFIFVSFSVCDLPSLKKLVITQHDVAPISNLHNIIFDVYFNQNFKLKTDIL